MTKFLTVLAIAGATLPAMAQQGVPRVLIYQTRVPLRGGVDVNITLDVSLAVELEATGRASAVEWRMTDPVFRGAVLNNVLKDVPDAPTPNQVMATAGLLHADYVLMVNSVLDAGRVKAKAQLFHAGRSIWKDATTLGVFSGSQQSDADTAHSIAHTWALKIAAGPFQGVRVQTKAPTPEPLPGQAPTVVPPTPAAPAPVDDDNLRKQVEALVKDQRPGNAVILARDSVDAMPLDSGRRLILIDLLEKEGHPAEAASEARHAADVLSDQNELRLRAARAWIAAGNLEEAQTDLNEAVAREPNAVEARLLLGELCLQRLQPQPALDHFDAVLKAGPTSDAYFDRALCRSLLGGADGVQLDLAEAAKDAKTTEAARDRRYRLAAAVLGKVTANDADQLRSMISKAVVKPKDQDLRDQADSMKRGIQARIALLSAMDTPAVHKGSSGRLLLAQNLLNQTLQDVESIMGGGGEDVATDARINLGDAMKQISAVQTALDSEK